MGRRIISIEELKNFEFHDLPLEKLSVDFSREEVYMEVALYNEDDEDYDYIAFVFEKVKAFSISDLAENTELDAEIYGREVEILDDGRYFIKFTILLGQPAISSFLQFSYSACYRRDLEDKS